MKKIISAILFIFLLFSVCCADEIMNNDLFKVVFEIKEPQNIIVTDFINTSLVKQGSLYKAICAEVSYKGDVTVTNLCEATDYNTAYNKMLEKSKPMQKNEYNDGLKQFYDGFSFLGFVDINNNTVHSINNALNCEYNYNLGYIFENYGNATKITNVFNNQEYNFKCNVMVFNNDGYTIITSNNKKYVAKLKKIAMPTVFLNKNKIYFDVAPIIENGRTLVPLRAIFEGMGATVNWDDATKTVTSTLNGTTIKLKINDKNAYKNGNKVELDVPGKIYDGRTLVPIRFISEAFGAKVSWMDEMKRVDIDF